MLLLLWRSILFRPQHYLIGNTSQLIAYKHWKIRISKVNSNYMYQLKCSGEEVLSCKWISMNEYRFLVSLTSNKLYQPSRKLCFHFPSHRANCQIKTRHMNYSFPSFTFSQRHKDKQVYLLSVLTPSEHIPLTHKRATCGNHSPQDI